MLGSIRVSASKLTNRASTTEGLELRVDNNPVLIGLELKLHYVPTSGSSDQPYIIPKNIIKRFEYRLIKEHPTCSYKLLVLVQATHVPRVFVMINDIIVVRSGAYWRNGTGSLTKTDTSYFHNRQHVCSC
jgi:hypothetical protein